MGARLRILHAVFVLGLLAGAVADISYLSAVRCLLLFLHVFVHRRVTEAGQSSPDAVPFGAVSVTALVTAVVHELAIVAAAIASAAHDDAHDWIVSNDDWLNDLGVRTPASSATQITCAAAGTALTILGCVGVVCFAKVSEDAEVSSSTAVLRDAFTGQPWQAVSRTSVDPPVDQDRALDCRQLTAAGPPGLRLSIMPRPGDQISVGTDAEAATRAARERVRGGAVVAALALFTASACVWPCALTFPWHCSILAACVVLATRRTTTMLHSTSPEQTARFRRLIAFFLVLAMLELLAHFVAQLPFSRGHLSTRGARVVGLMEVSGWANAWRSTDSARYVAHVIVIIAAASVLWMLLFHLTTAQEGGRQLPMVGSPYHTTGDAFPDEAAAADVPSPTSSRRPGDSYLAPPPAGLLGVSVRPDGLGRTPPPTPSDIPPAAAAPSADDAKDDEEPQGRTPEEAELSPSKRRSSASAAAPAPAPEDADLESGDMAVADTIATFAPIPVSALDMETDSVELDTLRSRRSSRRGPYSSRDWKLRNKAASMMGQVSRRLRSAAVPLLALVLAITAALDPSFLSAFWLLFFIFFLWRTVLATQETTHTSPITLGLSVALAWGSAHLTAIFVVSFPGLLTDEQSDSKWLEALGIGRRASGADALVLVSHFVLVFLIALVRNVVVPAGGRKGRPQWIGWIALRKKHRALSPLFDNAQWFTLLFLVIVCCIRVDLVQSVFLVFFLVFSMSSQAQRSAWPLLVVYCCAATILLYCYNVYTRTWGVPEKLGKLDWEVLIKEPWDSMWELLLYGAAVFFSLVQLELFRQDALCTEEEELDAERKPSKYHPSGFASIAWDRRFRRTAVMVAQWLALALSVTLTKPTFLSAGYFILLVCLTVAQTTLRCCAGFEYAGVLGGGFVYSAACLLLVYLFQFAALRGAMSDVANSIFGCSSGDDRTMTVCVRQAGLEIYGGGRSYLAVALLQHWGVFALMRVGLELNRSQADGFASEHWDRAAQHLRRMVTTVLRWALLLALFFAVTVTRSLTSVAYCSLAIATALSPRGREPYLVAATVAVIVVLAKMAYQFQFGDGDATRAWMSERGFEYYYGVTTVGTEWACGNRTEAACGEVDDCCWEGAKCSPCGSESMLWFTWADIFVLGMCLLARLRTHWAAAANCTLEEMISAATVLGPPDLAHEWPKSLFFTVPPSTGLLCGEFCKMAPESDVNGAPCWQLEEHPQQRLYRHRSGRWFVTADHANDDKASVAAVASDQPQSTGAAPFASELRWLRRGGWGQWEVEPRIVVSTSKPGPPDSSPELWMTNRTEDLISLAWNPLPPRDRVKRVRIRGRQVPPRRLQMTQPKDAPWPLLQEFDAVAGLGGVELRRRAPSMALSQCVMRGLEPCKLYEFSALAENDCGDGTWGRSFFCRSGGLLMLNFSGEGGPHVALTPDGPADSQSQISAAGSNMRFLVHPPSGDEPKPGLTRWVVLRLSGQSGNFVAPMDEEVPHLGLNPPDPPPMVEGYFDAERVALRDAGLGRSTVTKQPESDGDAVADEEPADVVYVRWRPLSDSWATTFVAAGEPRAEDGEWETLYAMRPAGYPEDEGLGELVLQERKLLKKAARACRRSLVRFVRKLPNMCRAAELLLIRYQYDCALLTLFVVAVARPEQACSFLYLAALSVLAAHGRRIQRTRALHMTCAVVCAVLVLVREFFFVRLPPAHGGDTWGPFDDNHTFNENSTASKYWRYAGGYPDRADVFADLVALVAVIVCSRSLVPPEERKGISDLLDGPAPDRPTIVLPEQGGDDRRTEADEASPVGFAGSRRTSVSTRPAPLLKSRREYIDVIRTQHLRQTATAHVPSQALGKEFGFRGVTEGTGVEVTEVARGSSAEECGLAPGMHIVAADESATPTLDAFMSVATAPSVGPEVKLEVSWVQTLLPAPVGKRDFLLYPRTPFDVFCHIGVRLLPNACLLALFIDATALHYITLLRAGRLLLALWLVNIWGDVPWRGDKVWKVILWYYVGVLFLKMVWNVPTVADSWEGSLTLIRTYNLLGLLRCDNLEDESPPTEDCDGSVDQLGAGEVLPIVLLLYIQMRISSSMRHTFVLHHVARKMMTASENASRVAFELRRRAVEGREKQQRDREQRRRVLRDTELQLGKLGLRVGFPDTTLWDQPTDDGQRAQRKRRLRHAMIEGMRAGPQGEVPQDAGGPNWVLSFEQGRHAYIRDEATVPPEWERDRWAFLRGVAAGPHAIVPPVPEEGCDTELRRKAFTAGVSSTAALRQKAAPSSSVRGSARRRLPPMMPVLAEARHTDMSGASISESFAGPRSEEDEEDEESFRATVKWKQTARGTYAAEAPTFFSMGASQSVAAPPLSPTLMPGAEVPLPPAGGGGELPDLKDEEGMTRATLLLRAGGWLHRRALLGEKDACECRQPERRGLWEPMMRVVRGMLLCIEDASGSICCLIFAINFASSLSLSDMLPSVSSFLYAQLVSPRPPSSYWRRLMIYVEFVIMAKCIAQAVIATFGGSLDPLLLGKLHSQSFFRNVLGDFLALLAITYHQQVRRSRGLWHPRSRTAPPRTIDDVRVGAAELYEAPDQNGTVWPVTVRGRNDGTSGTVSVDVEDGVGTHWESVHWSFLQIRQRRVGESIWSRVKRHWESAMLLREGCLSKKMSQWERVECRSSPKDWYVVSFMSDVLTTILFASLYSSLEGDSAFDLSDAIAQNLLPGPLVVGCLLLVILICVDRVIYLRRHAPLKYAFHVVTVIAYHVGIVWWWRGSIESSSSAQTAGAFIFLTKATWMWFSAAQIRDGYPSFLGHDCFTNKTQGEIVPWISYYTYLVLRAIPFLWEIRVLLDWSCAKTSLKRAYWLKLENLRHEVFLRRIDRLDSLDTNPHPGSRYPTRYKCGSGWLCNIIILVVIFFPLFYYSTFSPALQSNGVERVNIGLRFEGTPEIFAGALTVPKADQLEDNGQLTHWLTRTRPWIDSQTTGRNLQLAELPSFSSEGWYISAPAKAQLREALSANTTGAVQILVLTVTVHRVRGAVALRAAQLPQMQYEINSTLGTEIAELLGWQGQGAIPPAVRLPGLLYPFIASRSKGLELLSADKNDCVLHAAGGVNDVYYTLNCTTLFALGNQPSEDDPAEKKCYFPPSSDCPDYENHPPNHLGGGPYLVVVSDIVTSGDDSAISGLLDIGITAIFVTYVLAVGRLLREVISGNASAAIVQDMEDPDRIAGLVDSVHIARYDANLVLEERIYFTLIDLLRSPDTLLRITGPRVRAEWQDKVVT